MVGRFRQRHPHFIAGLGDGNVQKSLKEDHHLLDPDTQEAPYVRSGRTQKAFRNARDMFHEFPVSGDGIATPSVRGASADGSWQISAMALLCLMGLLVGFFLHLVHDSSEKHHATRRTSPTKKKKTDEWSSDEHEDAYTADTESMYYPYHPRYGHAQKQGTRSISNSGTLHHRMPVASRATTTTTTTTASPGPTLRTTRSIDSGTVLSSRNRVEGVPCPEEDAATTAAASLLISSPWKSTNNTSTTLNARPLSPVSSFASSQQNTSMSHNDSIPCDEELGTPPMKCDSFDAKHPSVSSNVGVSSLDETPRAGTRQCNNAIFVEKYMHKTPPLPPPPEHEPLLQQNVTRANKTPMIMLPYIPDLAFSQEYATQHEEHHVSPPELRHSKSESAAAHGYPGHLISDEELPEIRRQLSSPMPSNVARRNIIHKRPDVTMDTNAESSLMGSVDFEELTLHSVIGGGGFGQVWRATWRSTPVAVKILTGSAQQEIVTRGILEEFAAEINMLKGMRHPNICLYMGACLKPPNRAIITELASNGSLWDALRLPLSAPFHPCDGQSRDAWPLSLYSDSCHGGVMPSTYSPPIPPKGTWPWNLVKRVACGAARGMTYLHSGTPPVLHRDLKSANLLLDDSYTCKVCDFGLSRLKAQERSMTGNCGTVQWMAPEILSNQHYAEPADVYSFGIILWELLVAECPFEGMSAIQCALAVLNRDARPEIPPWCPPSFAALIRACWDKDPTKRPTFPQILLALDAMP